MITLRITFLLAISIKQEVKQIQKKSKRPVKQPRKKKNRIGSKKSLKSKSSKKTRREGIKRSVIGEEDVNYSIIQVSEPVKYLHIEYELFPKKFNYAIDLVCWGPVAKIYATNTSKCLTTVIQNNLIWVPVFIEHYVEQLDTEDIKSLLEQTIQISIKMGKNNVGTQAKNDNITTFYQFKDEKSSFSEVYVSRPSSDHNDKIKNEIERIWKKLLLLPVKKEIISWIYNIDEAHAYQISKILIKRFRGDDVYGKDCIVDAKDHDESGPKSSKKRIKSSKRKSHKTNNKTSKNKSKKSKSSKSSKGQTKFNDSTMRFKIPACTFISDPLLATFETKETNVDITEAYILLSSNNLLTLSQKKELAPFVMKIRKVSNLSFDILTKQGFEKVYVKCTIPGITEFETLPKPVSQTIRFNDSRVICTNDIPKIKLVEMLQTKQTYAEIIGLKEMPAPPIAKTSKQKKGKKKKKRAKKITPEPRTLTKNVVLAMATYDLSSLANTFFVFKEKQPCYNIESIFVESSEKFDDYFIDIATVNELNRVVYPSRINPSRLDNGTLMWNNTTVKFEAHFLTPQYPAFHLKGISSSYKRFVVVIFNEDIAKSLCRDIVTFNSKFQGPSAILFPNLLVGNKNNSESMLSGFVIDDGNCFIFYVEGLANGGILNVLYQVSNYSYPDAKVFYSSEHLFEERIYTTFFSRTGFLVINLKIPLKDILETQQIFLPGNIPIPCLIAIQKLHLILKSNTFKAILNHNLLPSELELISLSLEFGVQFDFEKGLEDIPPSMEESVIPLHKSTLF